MIERHGSYRASARHVNGHAVPGAAPNAGADASARARIRASVLVVVLLVSFAYFHQAGGWNQDSRFDLVRAIIEQGTLWIDDYASNTADKVVVRGHVYSDKAPGLALTAVPVVMAARAVLPAREAARGVTPLFYVATVATAAVPTSLAALLVLWLALRLGSSRGGAVFAALAFGLGTPAWAYATLFTGHALTTACVLAAFAAAVALAEDGGPHRDVWLGLAVGLAAGWATLTEFPAAVPAAIVTALALVHVGRARCTRVMPALGAGAAVPLAVLLAHNVAAFGGPFQLGYSYNTTFTGMQQGLMGVTTPKLAALWGILGGRAHGLFPNAPVLIAAPVGMALLVRGAHWRAGVAAAALVVYYVLLNASYVYWSGGWVWGPRHMAPALPFLCLGLAFAWTHASLPLRAALGAAACASGALTFVAVATNPQPPDYLARPVEQLLWPAFRVGKLSLNRGAWNVGQLVGLEGHASLLPLVAVWLAAAVAYWRVCRTEPGS